MTDRRTHGHFADAFDVARRLQPAEPVFCLRPAEIRRLATRFGRAFPGRTLYALKCNPHPTVVGALVDGGVNAFDVASLGEIKAIGAQVANATCYFMNPVKSRPAIAAARHVHGVTVFAVDHPDELRKLTAELGHDPDVTIVVRLKAASGTGAVFDLDTKFGADPETAIALLRAAHAAGYGTGLAFHVGSQCLSPAAYADALAQAGHVLAAADPAIRVLDVGGGFPAPYAADAPPGLDAYMDALKAGLARLGPPPDCEILAEPGRALVATGCSLLVKVLLRKGDRLYLNDGVFGGLSKVGAAGLRVPGRIVRPAGPAPAGAPRRFDAAGPTCNSLDMLPGLLSLPDDVREGDWIELDCIGAYSSAQTTGFNGFSADTFVEVADPPPLVQAC